MVEYADSFNQFSVLTKKKLTLAVIQNLEDAGCDKKTVEQFMELGETGEIQGQLRLLENHRRSLLNHVHKKQKQIDCLDYLVYQMRKEKQRKM